MKNMISGHITGKFNAKKIKKNYLITYKVINRYFSDNGII